MGEWTGRWKCNFMNVKKCKCECGKEGGVERYVEIFDAEHLDSMQHDGETREVIRYICPDCIKKYGQKRIV